MSSKDGRRSGDGGRGRTPRDGAGDARRGGRDRGHRARAHAADRVAGHRLGQPGQHGDAAAEGEALVAGLRRRGERELVDPLHGQLGAAAQELADRLHGEVVRAGLGVDHVGACLDERAADALDEDDVAHGASARALGRRLGGCRGGRGGLVGHGHGISIRCRWSGRRCPERHRSGVVRAIHATAGIGKARDRCYDMKRPGIASRDTGSLRGSGCSGARVSGSRGACARPSSRSAGPCSTRSTTSRTARRRCARARRRAGRSCA